MSDTENKEVEPEQNSGDDNKKGAKMCIDCGQKQVGYHSVDPQFKYGVRIYCHDCAYKPGAKKNVKRSIWDSQYKADWKCKKLAKLVVRSSEQSEHYLQLVEDARGCASSLTLDTGAGKEIDLRNWGSTKLTNEVLDELRKSMVEVGYCITDVYFEQVVRLKYYSEKELCGSLGFDMGEGWEPIFQARNEDPKKMDELTSGDGRCMQKRCNYPQVKTDMTDIALKLSRLLGMPDVATRNINYLGRWEGCQRQIYHRDSTQGYFVIASLCNDYEHFVVDGSHVLADGKDYLDDVVLKDRGEMKSIKMIFGDVFIGHGTLIHAGGPSPMALDDHKSSYRFPGCHCLASGKIGMNRLSVHVYLDPMDGVVHANTLRENRPLPVDLVLKNSSGGYDVVST